MKITIAATVSIYREYECEADIEVSDAATDAEIKAAVREELQKMRRVPDDYPGDYIDGYDKASGRIAEVVGGMTDARFDELADMQFEVK